MAVVAVLALLAGWIGVKPATATAVSAAAGGDAIHRARSSGSTATASTLGRPWPGRTITYFNGAHRWRAVVDRAARTWSWARIGIKLRRVSHRGRAEVQVTEVPNRVLGRYAGRAQLGYAPGYTATFKIAHNICCKFALQTALHEWGHILGLDHRRGVCAVMQPGALRGCPRLHPRPWLKRCRLLQRDDIRRASALYGGSGRLRPLYCRVRPRFQGRFRLLDGQTTLSVFAGRWARGVAVRIGRRCGEGQLQRHGQATVRIALGERAGCARFWTLYRGRNRSQAIDVQFRPRPPGRSPTEPASPELADVSPEFIPRSPVLILDEGFEASLAGRWLSAGGWGRTGASAHEGLYSVADSPGGPYLDETDSTLELATPLDLSNRSGCSLAWYARYEIEQGFDYLVIEMRRDAGPWNEVGARVSGNSGGYFYSFFADLAPFEGSPSVRMRLHFKSDISITGEGVEVDDIRITCDE